MNLNFQAMFISTCEEVGIFSEQPPKTNDSITDDGGVSVPNVWIAVHVVDRRGAIENLAHVFLRLRINQKWAG